MRRQRFEPPGSRVYENADDFLSSVQASGMHSIKVGAQWLDIQFEDRGSDTTLVAFHGAASKNITRLPYFTGRGTAEHLGWNLIALSDPSLLLGDIDLAWFIGNRGIGLLHKRLSPMIKHLLGESYPVLFGGSGGAYAAIWFAQDFPGSSVVVFNPRLHLSAPPESAMSIYMSVCHQTTKRVSPRTIRRQFVTEDLGDFYKDGLPFDLYILQNSGDKPFLRNQLEPFINRHGSDPRLQVKVEYFGGGHKAVIPRDTLHDFLLTARDAARVTR